MITGLENMTTEELKSFTYKTKDPDVLTELSRHPDIKIRKEVVFNPYTPIEVLERMQCEDSNSSLEGFCKRAIREKKRGWSLRNVFHGLNSYDEYDDDSYPSRCTAYDDDYPCDWPN